MEASLARRRRGKGHGRQPALLLLFPTDVTRLFAAQPHTYPPPLPRSPAAKLLLDTLEDSVESKLTSKSKIVSKQETKQNGCASQPFCIIHRGCEAKTALAQSQFEQIDKRTVEYIYRIPMLQVPRLGPLVQFTSPPQSLVSATPCLSVYKAKKIVTMHPRPLHESNARSKLETCKEPSSHVAAAAAEAIYAPRPKPTKPYLRRERRLASRGEEEKEGKGAERDFPPRGAFQASGRYSPSITLLRKVLTGTSLPADLADYWLRDQCDKELQLCQVAHLAARQALHETKTGKRALKKEKKQKGNSSNA